MSFVRNIKRGSVSPMGVSVLAGRLNIAVSPAEFNDKEFGIVFYEGEKELERVVFPKKYRFGNLYAVSLQIDLTRKLSYLFFCGDELMMDPYAKIVIGRESWGDDERDAGGLRAGILTEETDARWEQDRPLGLAYEDTILYSLHVRGFTKHSSSHVKKKGSFAGLKEKIPYLKELGVTSVLAMPVYEFDEVIINPAYREMNPALGPYYEEGKDIWKSRINYWGFSEKGNYYFAPKHSYSSGNDPARELRELICSLHENGLEFLMQMYFPKELSPDSIREVLHYWVLAYHVDGFQLMGEKLPMELLGKDALLGCTKLIAEHTGADRIYPAENSPAFKNLGLYQEQFRYQTRRFLKGDSDFVYAMTENMTCVDGRQGIINHITDYRGFTLLDLVSYDRKHNEPNGENNRDGSDYNYSWNCGAEGASRKKSIQRLRLSQRKNAAAMLLLSQGVPLLLAGDEAGRTTLGNNNAYCQDNATNYVNWNRNKADEEIFQFFKALIAYRKEHGILHQKTRLRQMDSLSCGYPDLSFHGEQAWQTQFENYNHHLGILYCGFYEEQVKTADVLKRAEKRKGAAKSRKPEFTGEFVYLALNMHWIEHCFHLPLLPEGFAWELSLVTKEEVQLDAEISKEDGGENVKRTESVLLPPRSVAVLTGKPCKKKNTGAKKKRTSNKTDSENA